MRALRTIGLISTVLFTTFVAAGEQKGAFHVTASTDSGLASAGWWKLDIGGDGSVALVGDARSLRKFSIPSDRVRALRESAKGLLSLYAYQGSACVDCPSCTLEVELNGQKRSVRFGSSRGSSPSPDERKHAQEFLTVWAAVKAAAGQTSLPDPCLGE
jgi:hypothetical protein